MRSDVVRTFVNIPSPDVPSALADTWVFLPVGGVEQHGPHLPLHVDTVLAQSLCEEVAASVRGILAPAIPYGARSLPASGGGDRFPGTIPLPGEVLIGLYRAVIQGLVEAGAQRLFILNGHWENEAFLFEAMDQCRQEGRVGADVSLIGLSWWSVVSDDDMRDVFGSFLGWNTEHAAQAETALMLHYAGDTVQMERAVDHHGHVPTGLYAYPIHDKMRSDHGVLGRSRHATVEQGEHLSLTVVKGLVALIDDHPAVGGAAS